MKAYFNDNEKKEKLSSIAVLREYKRKNNIEDSGYSYKIASRFNEMIKETTNINFKKIGELNHINFAQIIKDTFKDFDTNLKKLELDVLINIKLRNACGTNLKVEKEDNKFSKLIKEKLTSIL